MLLWAASQRLFIHQNMKGIRNELVACLCILSIGQLALVSCSPVSSCFEISNSSLNQTRLATPSGKEGFVIVGAGEKNIFAIELDENGNEARQTILGNENSTLLDLPVSAILPDNRIVVVWMAKYQESNRSAFIEGAIVDSKTGIKSALSTAATSDNVEAIELVVLNVTSFAVVWSENLQGIGTSIYTQVYNAEGEKVGNKGDIHSEVTNRAELGVLPSDSPRQSLGSYMVYYISNSSTINAKRVVIPTTASSPISISNATKVGTNFSSGSINIFPAAVKFGNGTSFVVSFLQQRQIPGSNSSFNDVYYQRFAKFGNPLADPVLVKLDNGGGIVKPIPHVFETKQGFAITWKESSGVRLQTFTANENTTALTKDVLLTAPELESSGNTFSSAELQNGKVILVWEDGTQACISDLAQKQNQKPRQEKQYPIQKLTTISYMVIGMVLGVGFAVGLVAYNKWAEISCSFSDRGMPSFRVSQLWGKPRRGLSYLFPDQRHHGSSFERWFSDKYRSPSKIMRSGWTPSAQLPPTPNATSPSNLGLSPLPVTVYKSKYDDSEYRDSIGSRRSISSLETVF